MRSVKNEFPNPVLINGQDDYISSCRFSTFFDDASICVTDKAIEIPVRYELECNGLRHLVEKNVAKVVVTVKSSAASFSRLFQFDSSSPELHISIPKYDVVRRIEIVGSIIAVEPIKQFECPGEFNDLYFDGATFDIRKGDILATEDPRIFYVDDTEMEKPIASIFNIRRCDLEMFDEIETDFNDEKIEIRLSPELHDLYCMYKDYNNGALRRYATGMIVYPALIEAVTYVIAFQTNPEQADDDLSDRRWFRAIEHVSEKQGISLGDQSQAVVAIANKILGEIVSDSLRSFKSILESEMSGETETIGGVD